MNVKLLGIINKMKFRRLLNELINTIFSKIIIVLSIGLLMVLSACDGSTTQQKANGTEQKVVNDIANNTTDINIWPKLNSAVKKDLEMEKSITELLSKMTIEQKVAQMIQPEIRDITVNDMRRYGFGSYLNGGGSFPDNDKHSTPADWINLAESMYQASIDDSIDGSTIPTMWGTDAVHGHNNVIGATLFPHNIGLGAANNPDLIEKIASITAREVMVTGIDWVFAPTVAVVRDDRWGRTYEGYSEDPAIVKSYSASIVKGLQGAFDDDFLGDERVIATVKHFLGDGGTQAGDDQGNNIASEQELFSIHGQGYVGGLTAGAQTVMASFNSWHGVKNHGNKYLLTDVLKTRMGFDGLVVGDWNGHGQIKGCSNDNCSKTINAGLDIFMVPTDAWKPLLENTIAQVKSGEISIDRIDDAVSRILRVKFRAGLFDKPSPANRPLSGKTSLIGAREHRAVARQAVRESLVLLKNKDHLLPLQRNQRVLVAGDAADNIGKQSGGWTITWQGTNNDNKDFPGSTSIYTGIQQMVEAAGGSTELSVNGEFEQKPDVAIVVFGEEPYAEGNGDLDNLEYQRGNKRDLQLLKKLKQQNIPVVSLFVSGRPMWVNAEMNASDAFVAIWLPGSEGNGIADVIFRNSDAEVNFDFKGKLSFSWPATPEQTTVNNADLEYSPLLPYGFGLRYGDDNILSDTLNEVSDSHTRVNETLVIFNKAEQAPWVMEIGDSDQQTNVTSSVQNNKTVAIKTFDRHVQEDARQIMFSGSGNVSLTSSFPTDLRSYLESHGSLTFSIKVDEPASTPVFIEMRCQQQCKAGIDLSTIFTPVMGNKWNTMSIDLACFEKAGADMAQIITPFSVVASGKFALSFSDIRIEPNNAGSANLICQ